MRVKIIDFEEENNQSIVRETRRRHEIILYIFKQVYIVVQKVVFEDNQSDNSNYAME